MTRSSAFRGLLALVLCLPACRKDPTPVQPPVPVTAGVAERRDVPFELAATGTVEPLQTVAVQSQVSGPIVRIDFREGQEGLVTLPVRTCLVAAGTTPNITYENELKGTF